MTDETVSDVVAERIRDLRKRRGWSIGDLAARCQERGATNLTANVIENIESGRRKDGQRRRDLTIDEVLTLAMVLNVAPVHLVVPVDDPDLPYPVIGGVLAHRFSVRAWIRGIGVIDPGADPREFGAEVPRGEFYWPTYTDHDGVQIHATQQGAPRPRTEPDEDEV